MLAMVAAQTALAEETSHAVTAESQPFVFVDSRITVRIGDTVTWTVGPGAPHTITSGTYNASGVHADGLFDSGTRTAGETFSVTFTEAGDVSYVCTIHADAGMVGRILVRDATGADGPSSLVLFLGLVAGLVLAIALRLRFSRRPTRGERPSDRG